MSSATSSRGTLNISHYRRKSQVFVEIPPSPLFKARVAPTPIKVDDLSTFHIAKSHKENAPPLTPKTSVNNIPPAHRNTSKRKVEHDDDGDTLGAKKAKIPRASNESDHVACHQCRSKKPSSSILQCTSTSKNGNRCKASYCDTCLRNRYGKELRAIAKGNSLGSQECNSDKTYHFICPRCDGNCNCAPCRKRRGLAPVGKFSVRDGESVREILERNPKALGLLPKHTVAPVPKDLTSPKVDVSTKLVDVLEDSAQGSLKISRKKQAAVNPGTKKTLKVVPEPVWVPVPYLWSKAEIENRIQIREFVLRFNPILNIGLRNLEELDDFTSLHDQSTKAVLLSLLDLLAIEDETHKKKIQETVKVVRSLGTNWVKIVPALYDLRSAMPRGHALYAIPDLSHSDTDTETTYHTRGGRIKGVSVDQLLPILLYFVQVACEGASVRQELEEGYKQAKDIRTAYLQATREEQERWAAQKAELIEAKPGAETKKKESTGTWKIEFRDAEAKHKAIVAQIQNSHKPEIDACAPRFRSLGRDTDGRIYYALSASGPQRGKKERLPSESERFALKRWGWFIAVYGKPGAVIQRGSENDMDEDISKEERWWGFADVEEMRKLSKWLAYCAEVDPSDPSVGGTRSIKSSADLTATLSSRLPSTSAISRFESSKLSLMGNLSNSRSDNIGMDQYHDRSLERPGTSSAMKALAKAVLEFADFTEWRLNREQTNSKRKGDDAMAPTKFYD